MAFTFDSRSNAAMNTGVQIFAESMLSIGFGTCVKLELLNYMIILFLILGGFPIFHFFTRTFLGFVYLFVLVFIITFNI